jgi:hypothetical protein
VRNIDGAKQWFYIACEGNLRHTFFHCLLAILDVASVSDVVSGKLT